ncbi:MAG: polyphosphate polymerase domain-containing protein [Bacteroidales bacterium]|nr:polyphosphate polymerase domain-containing protein [Bacteroidales bacterium]
MSKTRNYKRYERKFIVELMDFYQVEAIIKCHPAAFRTIHHPRFINNIYFDTPNFNYYYDNHFGKADRVKVRIRWYGDSLREAQNPFLEIKYKKGLVGDKQAFPLPPFTIEPFLEKRALMNHILQAEIPDHIKAWIKNLEPKVANRYRRRYFLTMNKRYRLTVDTSIQYFGVEGRRSTLKKCYSEEAMSILELKYKMADEETAGDITMHLPFRMDKNSKYVNAVDCFNYMGAV